MSEWRPIASAPKDGASLLLYGRQTQPHPDVDHGPKSFVFTGYWDPIDDGWCSSSSTWQGPFFEPTHWMPLPAPPTQERPDDKR